MNKADVTYVYEFRGINSIKYTYAILTLTEHIVPNKNQIAIMMTKFFVSNNAE